MRMTKRIKLKSLLLAGSTAFLLSGTSVTFAQTFEEALAAAYNSNPQIQAQRSRLREIDESYVQARSQGLPQSSLEGQIGGTYIEREGVGGLPGTDDTGTSNSAGISVSQPLYQGGRVKGLKSQAKAQILAARAELSLVEQGILLTAAESYLDVLRDEKAAEIRRNNVNVLLKQLDANETRFSVGDGTRTDIAQAQTRLEESKKGLSQANANLTISRAGFLRVIGFMPENLSEPSRYDLPQTLAEAQSRAKQHNPRVLVARYLEDAADASIDVAKSALKPTVSLNGSLQTGESEFSNFIRQSSASVAAQLRVPLYTGGLNRSRVRAAKEARVQRRFETRDQEDFLAETIAQAWAQLKAAEEILAASRNQVESARIAFEGVSLEQSVGTRDALDVLNAEQEFLNAQLSEINAERDVLFLSYQLLAAMGEFGARELTLPADYHDRSKYLEEISGKRFDEEYPEAELLGRTEFTGDSSFNLERADRNIMTIKATGPSFVEIKKETGEVVLSSQMKAGESWMAEPDGDYVLSAKNSGALELYMDNELMGVLGAEGVAMKDVPMPAVMAEHMTDAARNRLEAK